MKYFKLSFLFLVMLTLANCSTEPASYTNQQGDGTPGPTYPTLSTVEVTSINFTTATSGGIIVSNGGSPIIEKGIVWSLNQNPTTQLATKTIEGPDGEVFASNMTNLESNKTYFVRAYARNGKGVAYGQQIEFQTLVDINSLPRVTTAIATTITTNSAKLGGNVTSSGILPVTARGIVWSITPDPENPPTTTVNLGITTNGTGLGSFVDELTSLIPNTTYFVRAYATSLYGTNYGELVTFTTTALLFTAGTGVTDVDGNTYNTITIDGQEWSTKNLNVAKYRNGDVIPQVQDAAQWAALTTGAWCYYANVTANGTTYGKLYNWYAVNDARGIAPEGWHVPTNVELISLIDFLGGADVAGGFMKEAGSSNWETPNTGATNSSGLKALPGGYAMANGSFSNLGTKGYWWASDSYNPSSAWCTGLYHNTKTITRAPIDKKQGFSVRIIKD